MMTEIKEKLRQCFYVCPCKCKKEINIACEFSRMECTLDRFSKTIRNLILKK